VSQAGAETKTGKSVPRRREKKTYVKQITDWGGLNLKRNRRENRLTRTQKGRYKEEKLPVKKGPVELLGGQIGLLEEKKNRANYTKFHKPRHIGK